MTPSTIQIDPSAAPTMYVTSWCGYCRRLRAHMRDAGIPFSEVDIEADEEAASFVEAANGGNQVVPTLRFADGTTATNPTIGEIIEILSR